MQKKYYSITIILILLNLIVAFFTVNNYLRINKQIESKNKSQIELDSLKKEETTLNKEYASLKKEYDECENVFSLINKTKAEVFEEASKVEHEILNGKTDKKIAYITFDDGPYYLTNKILDILNEYQVRATFFTIGYKKDTCYDNRKYSCRGTYKKIVDSGHTIANHTYSHAIFKGLYSNADTFMDDVKKQEELIYSRTGVKTNILRFPGGFGTAKHRAKDSINEIKRRLSESGYGWVDWTCLNGDSGNLPSQEVAWSKFTGGINENIEVVLFHDYNKISAAMLPDAIKYLEDRGYILLPLFYKSVKINK